MLINPEEKIAFDMYFASIASMQHHPGAGTKEHVQLSMEECCDKAIQMLEIRRKALTQDKGR